MVKLDNRDYIEKVQGLLNFWYVISNLGLTTVEEQLLIWRFYNNLTYKEIQPLFGELCEKGYCSRQNVEIRLKSALAKVKRQAKEQNRLDKLKTYLKDICS